MIDLTNAFKKILPFLFSDWSHVTRPLTEEELALKEKLEFIVGSKITNFSYFITALTHRSAIEMSGKLPAVSNERLEYLGDAVLDLVVAEFLYKNYESSDEGKLTKLRSQIVNWKSLCELAKRIGLGELLIVSEAAHLIGIRQSETALADAMEALIGAVYLDSHYEATRRFVADKMLSSTNLEKLISLDENYKSALLEYAQSKKFPIPVYYVIEEQGPAHKKLFVVAAKIGERMLGEGRGYSKKDAEQLAAQAALEKLKQEG